MLSHLLLSVITVSVFIRCESPVIEVLPNGPL